MLSYVYDVLCHVLYVAMCGVCGFVCQMWDANVMYMVMSVKGNKLSYIMKCNTCYGVVVLACIDVSRGQLVKSRLL